MTLDEIYKMKYADIITLLPEGWKYRVVGRGNDITYLQNTSPLRRGDLQKVKKVELLIRGRV